MKHYFRASRVALAILLLPLVFQTATTGGEQPSKVDDKMIQLWVELLANLSPAREHNGDVGEDRLTDKELRDLRHVENAYRALTRNFEQALPILVAHIDDKRYSFPREHPSSGYYKNQSVGDACQSIIDRKLLLQNPMILNSGDKAVWRKLPIDGKWLKRVQKMSLFEMQLDSLDWLLRQPPLTGVDRTEWKSALAEVRKFRDEFQTNGKAEDKEFGPPIQGK